MKNKFLWLFICSCILSFSQVCAQDTASGLKTYTIIDELLSDNSSSQGTIRIQSDQAITALIGFPANPTSAISGEQETIKLNGYRIQAFVGNDPRHSKAEALSKEKQVKEFFPEVSTYVTYDSPNWRLRIGDFRTRDEAVVFMQELKRTFPDLGKEMFPVVAKIRVPIDKSN